MVFQADSTHFLFRFALVYVETGFPFSGVGNGFLIAVDKPRAPNRERSRRFGGQIHLEVYILIINHFAAHINPIHMRRQTKRRISVIDYV